MNKLLIAAVSSLFLCASTGALADCAAQAVGKDGKPLAGAAKTAFLKKCEADAKAAK